jgi:hypothetical protein
LPPGTVKGSRLSRARRSQSTKVVLVENDELRQAMHGTLADHRYYNGKRLRAARSRISFGRARIRTSLARIKS